MKEVDFFTPGARLARELECLLMDTRNDAAQSRWWDSAHEALEQWRQAMRAMEASIDAVQPEASTTLEQAPAIDEVKEPELWRCTVCGRVGTVGRCCGEETRERTDIERLLDDLDALRAENARLRDEVERLRTDGASAVRWAPSSAYWSDVLRELFGPDARKGIDVLERRWQAALERAEQLEEALRGWWMSRRPVGWTEDQHRSSPHVNLVTGAEKALADAMLRAREAGND